MFKFFVTVVVCLVAVRGEAQTVSGRSFLTGFELGSMAEGVDRGGSVQSGVVRSGAFAYRANPVNSNQFIAFQSRSAGGVLRQIFRSSRFYVRIAQLPVAGSVAVVKIGGATTYNPEVDLNADGSLTLADSVSPVLATSANKLPADGTWHRIEFDAGYGLKVYVDGMLWANASGKYYPAGGSIAFGAGQTPRFINATADLYFDDVLVDGDTFQNTGLPGDGRVALLRPALDPATLNGWTGGAGSNVNIYAGARTSPPAGKPAGQATNATQIRNGSHSGALDYKPSVQTYSEAGIPGNAQVNAVMAVVNDGLDSGKNAPSGNVWIASNPAQAAGGYSFDFGDASGAMGVFPTGWTTHSGPVSSNPAVNLSGAPIVSVRKASGSSVSVDFLGVYVDYR
jgi:hypothetical protein